MEYRTWNGGREWHSIIFHTAARAVAAILNAMEVPSPAYAHAVPRQLICVVPGEERYM